MGISLGTSLILFSVVGNLGVHIFTAFSSFLFIIDLSETSILILDELSHENLFEAAFG